MSADNLLSCDLTKWPRLLVAGEPVTETQANEIILRTTTDLYTNDRPWLREVCTELGLERAEYGGPHWESWESWRNSINGLDLRYLNNDRIMSAWIGGPKGWCDWDGTIGCDNYNIGKWPSATDVDAEWRLIAAAWSFLDLRCQLVPDEGDAMTPAVEWRVSNGNVEVVEPGILPMMRPKDPQFLAIFTEGRERGVSLDRLQVAINQLQAGYRIGVKDGRSGKS
jgi:hypothetical protein